MSQNPISDQRIFLHEILTNIEGVKKVYYEPPSSIKLVYPCLIYSLESYNTSYADNKRFLSWPRYSVILIDYDPESSIVKDILDLDNCNVAFDRKYSEDQLTHWSFTLYCTKGSW